MKLRFMTNYPLYARLTSTVMQQGCVLSPIKISSKSLIDKSQLLSDPLSHFNSKDHTVLFETSMRISYSGFRWIRIRVASQKIRLRLDQV